MTDDDEARLRAYLESLSPEEQAQIFAQAKLNHATSTIATQLARGDLLGAWPRVHPDLRLAWVQAWQIANTPTLHAQGWDRDTTAAALTSENPSGHELWEHFARVHTREIAQWRLDPERLGVATNPRPVALNIEQVHIYPTAPENIQHEPGQEHAFVPALMFLENDEWLLLNIGSTTIPTPGYPPEL